MDIEKMPDNNKIVIEDLIVELRKGHLENGKGFNVYAIKQLSEIGADAVEPLIASLKVGTPWERANVAFAWGQLGIYAQSMLWRKLG